MKSRFFSLMLCLLLLLGCIPSDAYAADIDYGKYDPPITMVFARSVGDTLLNDMAGKLDGETLESNRWTDLILDELGIKIVYQWVAKINEWAQKLNMAIAAEDLPDYFWVQLSHLKQLADADLLVDLGPAYEELAMPLTKNTLEVGGLAPFEAATIDGKLLSIPHVAPMLDGYSYLWMREDWLDTLGLQAPETTDDLEIIRQFTLNDPDGNGAKDTYGLLIDKSLWNTLNGFFYAYHAYPEGWIKKDGRIVYGGVQPEMKQPLRALQQLFKEGAIDPEFGVKDLSKADELVAAGRMGVYYGGHWLSVAGMQSGKINNPATQWSCYSIPSCDDQPAVEPLANHVWEYVVAKKGAANPEALVKLFNLYIEMLYGETGDYEHWGNDEIDGIWQMAPIRCHDPHVNLNAYRDIWEAINNGTETSLTGVALEYYNNYANYALRGDVAFWGWERMFAKEKSPFAVIDEVAKRNGYFTVAFVGTPTETMVERWSTLKELQDATVTRIILGELDVDEAFEKFVSDWRAMGGDLIEQEINEQ